MSRTTAERWRNLSDQLTTRIEAVPADRWDDPAPPEGWVARDVVRHLVEWMPGLYFSSVGLPQPEHPSVDDDPAGAWKAVDAAIQAGLDDPAVADRPTSSPAGEMSYEQLVDMTGLMDLLVHAWDLARATGQDEELDADEVHIFFTGIDPKWDEPMRASGHYGPAVVVPDSATEQTKLLAWTGRNPLPVA